MSDADRVLGWFRDGTLLRPDPSTPNLADLAVALARLHGAGIAESPNSAQIERAIGPADRLAFVLVDGLGMNLIRRLPEGSFLRSRVATELRAVFPTSTAPNLTTLATGLWPAAHAVPAWWTHLPDASVTATILQFTERFTGKPLAAAAGDVFPARPLPTGFRAVLPRKIVDSVYSRYSRGEGAATGYDELPQAVDAILAAGGAGFKHLYFPDLDSAVHHHGPASPEAGAVLARVDAELSRLATGLRGRLVVTADHGSIPVADADKRFIRPGDPFVEDLACPPSGEPRAIFLHAKPGRADAVAASFRERWGREFALLTIDEADALRLFGPTPLTPVARARIGDFVAFSATPHILLYGPPVHHKSEAAMKGYHGGLTADEVVVPLVVA